jgi:deoxyribodipyrimidine photolyase-related protein
MNTPQRAHTLRLLLGDQLNPSTAGLPRSDDGVVYVLMEVRQETDYVLHHAQKILAIFAAMRDLARHLREAGHRVRYVAIDDPSNRQSIPDNLAALMAHYGAQRCNTSTPTNGGWTSSCAPGVPCKPFAVQAVSSEHFYTTRTELAEVFKGRKQWLMEHFYRRMRQRHSVLIDEAGEPEGGQWNYDHDNRKPWPGTPELPPDARPTHDHSALWATIQAAGVQSFGNPQAHALRWPLNRAEALAWLDHFITTTLPTLAL